MAEPTARPMRLRDIEQVLQIERSSFSMPWSRDAFVREIVENQCARYLVLEARGRVVAYAGMWLVLDEGHITNIAVHPDARGRGYGEAITRALIQAAVDVGIRFLTLEVRRSNTIAQSLYKKLGFSAVGVRKRYYEDNREDAVLMSLAEPPDQRPSEISAFWHAFLEETGRAEDTACASCFHFGMTEKESNHLLSLALRGEKRAVCSSLFSFEKTGEPVPVPGDLAIVTDFYGHPRCVIETVRVATLPFNDISFEMCRREGMAGTRNDWRTAHIDLFRAEGAALGYNFSPELWVVFEDFTIIFPKRDALFPEI